MYFRQQVNDVEKIFPLGELSSEEQNLLEACSLELKTTIEKGRAFVQS